MPVRGGGYMPKKKTNTGQMVELKTLNSFKEDELIVRQNFRYKQDAKEYNLLGKKIFREKLIQDGVDKFIEKTKKRNKDKFKGLNTIRHNSPKYRKVRNRIIAIYFKMFFKIMINVLLSGNKFVFFRYGFTIHFSDMEPYSFTTNVKYKYYRALNGVYPLLRIALHPRLIHGKAAEMRVAKPALTLEGIFWTKISKMITHKIRKESLKLSTEKSTVVKFKK
jgi:hypothetical protein